MVAYTKPQQRKKAEGEQLRGEGDHISAMLHDELQPSCRRNEYSENLTSYCRHILVNVYNCSLLILIVCFLYRTHVDNRTAFL